MPRTEWPFTEVDPSCHPDSNLQHVLHVLEGYRSYHRGEDKDPPYSPGSARDISWRAGWDQAERDQPRPSS